MAAHEERELEIKFAVPDDGWTLPDLSYLVPAGGSLTRRSVELDSMHYDTVDHRLLRAGLTLRRRTGDDDTGWHLKVPAEDEARTEIRLPLEGRGVPAHLRQLTLGVRAGLPLRAVARLQTHRGVHVICGVDGSALVEVVEDRVTATRLGATAEITQWREVEVELGQGDEALLRRTAKRMRKAGLSTADYRSKLGRALALPDTGDSVPTGSLADAVQAYLGAQRDAIMTGDLGLRREHDVIHPTRVATRRYRSVLRVFGALFDSERASALDAELKWFAGVLGAVRDLQVLGAHLRSALADLPDEYVLGPVSARLEETLAKELAAARRALVTAMRGRRYLALLSELEVWAADPPLTEAAARPAKNVERYLRQARKKLDRRLEHAQALPDRDPGRNEAQHRARKAAKRMRYAAELSEPVLGKTARAAAKTAKTLQTELGDRQDAVVAIAFLRRVGAVAGTTPGENGFTFGILLADEVRRSHPA